MSVISFLILKNLKGLQDSDKQNEKKTGLLKKSAEKTAKNILRIKSENRNG